MVYSAPPRKVPRRRWWDRFKPWRSFDKTIQKWTELREQYPDTAWMIDYADEWISMAKRSRTYSALATVVMSIGILFLVFDLIASFDATQCAPAPGATPAVTTTMPGGR